MPTVIWFRRRPDAGKAHGEVLTLSGDYRTPRHTDGWPEAAARLRRLQLDAGRLAAGITSGTAATTWFGSGLDLKDLRPYRVGDETRAIDWRVTARTQRPYVRQFAEDRDRLVHVVLDGSASMDVPVPGRRDGKFSAASEAAALLLLAADRLHHRTQLTIAGRSPVRLPSGQGRRHASRLVAALARFRASGTDALASSLRRLVEQRSEPASVVILSDLYAAPPTEVVAALGRRHAATMIHLESVIERTWPKAGLVRLIDPESRRRTVVDTGSSRCRRHFAAVANRRREDRRRQLAKAGLRAASLDADKPIVDQLLALFAPRSRQ